MGFKWEAGNVKVYSTAPQLTPPWVDLNMEVGWAGFTVEVDGGYPRFKEPILNSTVNIWSGVPK